MMVKRLKLLLLALVILSQPFSVRARDLSTEEVLLYGTLTVLGAYGAKKIYDAVTAPVSDEDLIKKADNLSSTQSHVVTSWQSHRYSDSENDRGLFASSLGSLDAEKERLAQEIKEARVLQDELDARNLKRAASQLDPLIAMNDEKLSYIRRHEEWLRLYQSKNHLDSFLKKGCNDFYSNYGYSYPTISCIESFKNVLNDVQERSKSQGVQGSDLQREASALQVLGQHFVANTVLSAAYTREVNQKAAKEAQERFAALQRAAELERERIAREQKAQIERDRQIAQQLAQQERERIAREQKAAQEEKDGKITQQLHQQEEENQDEQARKAQQQRYQQQQSNQADAKQIKAINEFTEANIKVKAYEHLLSKKELSSEQKDELRAQHLYASEIKNDAVSLEAAAVAACTNSEASKKIIRESCKNSGDVHCSALTQFIQRCNGAAARVGKIETLVDLVHRNEDQEFNEVKTLIADVKTAYGAIMNDRSVSNQVATIRQQGMHDKYPITRYVQNIENEMEKNKAKVGHVCNNVRFKDTSVCREVLKLVNDLKDHMEAIKNTQAYQDETALFEDELENQTSRRKP
jgi:hypothetical protein